MKLSLKKIYSIAMAGIALLLFIFSFIDYVGDVSEWAKFARMIGLGASFSIFKLLICLCIIATYLLHLFKNIDEKWVKFANYGVGFLVFHYLVYFFNFVGEGTDVGFWFCTIFALGLGAVSVLWYFASDKPIETTKAPVIGYDQATGKPIYAKIKGYDPKTGKPIYEKN